LTDCGPSPSIASSSFSVREVSPPMVATPCLRRLLNDRSGRFSSSIGCWARFASLPGRPAPAVPAVAPAGWAAAGTGTAAVVASAPAAPAAPAVVPVPAAPPDSCAARLVANFSMTRPPTSAMTPRPNWAGRPVTVMLVRTRTRVCPASSVSEEVIVAAAVPLPRVSLPDASSTTVRVPSSFSVNRAVPA
jgi:hypothetical protein